MLAMILNLNLLKSFQGYFLEAFCNGEASLGKDKSFFIIISLVPYQKDKMTLISLSI